MLLFQEFRNYAEIEPPNDSVKKSRDCLEGKESMKDSFFDGTDSLENNEFKIEACYKGSSEKNELNIDSSCKNNVDEYHSNLPVSSRYVTI